MVRHHPAGLTKGGILVCCDTRARVRAERVTAIICPDCRRVWVEDSVTGAWYVSHVDRVEVARPA